MLTFLPQNMSRRFVKPVSSRCATFAKLSGILLKKWLSLLQMPWLVVVWTIVTLCLEVCHVLTRTSCRVFTIHLHILSQILYSMLTLHPSLSDSTGCLSITAACSKSQHWFINFYTVVLLAILDHPCPTLIINI